MELVERSDEIESNFNRCLSKLIQATLRVHLAGETEEIEEAQKVLRERYRKLYLIFDELEDFVGGIM